MVSNFDEVVFASHDAITLEKGIYPNILPQLWVNIWTDRAI